VIANRTYDRAERLAQILTEQGETDVLARAVPMESVPGELTRADIAVSCTGATGLVLTAGMVAAAVEGRVPEGAPSGPAARPEIRTGIRAVLPPTSVGSDDDCPLDLPAVQGGGFSVHGEDAVAGMDAATLEQHAAWVDNATVDRRASRRTPEREAPRTPAAEAELIAALAATFAVTGRITELRRPEPVVEAPRPEPVLALLDLAMPRDIDAAAHRLPGVRLVDIESLAEASADAPMAADVDMVRRIVSDEVAAFGAAQRAAHITPTVVALRAMAADVVASEIARLEGRLPGLDDKHRGEITQTVRRVVDKLLHAPTVRVKQLAAEPGGAGYADALRTLFDLDQETVAAVSRAEDRDQRTAGGQFVGANAENRGRS
jgi:glutamyl-tRNA reductase